MEQVVTRNNYNTNNSCIRLFDVNDYRDIRCAVGSTVSRGSRYINKADNKAGNKAESGKRVSAGSRSMVKASGSSRRREASARRVREARNANIKLAGLVIVLVIGILLVFAAKNPGSDASASTYKEKYFTSIRVESGDTLWAIADRYEDSIEVSKADFIEEVKSINNLKGSRIDYGARIVIPIYK